MRKFKTDKILLFLSVNEVTANVLAAFTAKYPIDSVEMCNGLTIEEPALYNI